MNEKEICWHTLLDIVKKLRLSITTSELGAQIISSQTKEGIRDILSTASRDIATTSNNGLMSYQDKLNLINKVDKIIGKGLSTNDFSNEEKDKLANLEYLIDLRIDELLETTPGTFDMLREITEWIENNGVEATELSSQLSLKVDKENGKSLMSDFERIKLNHIEEGAQVNPNMSLYVLKELGKDLSSNDYTDNDKDKLSSIEYGAQVNPDLTSYAKIVDVVQKQTGKGLSTNDYSTAEKNKLNGIQAGAQVNPDLSPYALIINTVVKESGKGLSANDYTTNEKNKLATIQTGAQVNPDLTPYVLRTEIGNVASFKIWTGQVRTTETNGYVTIDYSSAGFSLPPIVVATALTPNASTDTSANNAAWCSVVEGSVTVNGCRVRSKSADSAGLLAAMVSVNITTNINIIAIGK